MALGFRFEHGITVNQKCETAAVYLEQPARQATEYVERTYGLDTIEKEKLNLLGPYYLSGESLQIGRQFQMPSQSTDVIDLLDL
jgi:hypothetical protein